MANGSEGEPAAAKDATLLVLAPHLVFDGLALVAASLGAKTAYLAADETLLPTLSAHLAERRDPVGVRLHAAAPAFLSGEESALCSALEGSRLRRGRVPAVRERGVDGPPTLVLNVETLARLALIAAATTSPPRRCWSPGAWRSPGRPGWTWSTCPSAPGSATSSGWTARRRC